MNINKHIEHTLLKQDAKKEDFIKFFNEAKEFNFLGVCVNPLYVSFAKEQLQDSDVKVVTVVGFPLGANKSEVTRHLKLLKTVLMKLIWLLMFLN